MFEGYERHLQLTEKDVIEGSPPSKISAVPRCSKKIL